MIEDFLSLYSRAKLYTHLVIYAIFVIMRRNLPVHLKI